MRPEIRMRMHADHITVFEDDNDWYDPRTHTVTLGLDEMKAIAEHYALVHPKSREELRVDLARLLDPRIDQAIERTQMAMHQDFV